MTIKFLRFLGWLLGTVAVLWLVLFYLNWPGRRTRVFLIPDGYRGVFTVTDGIPGAPPLPTEDWTYVFRIPPDGKLRTSTSWDEGFGSPDEFYYVSGNRRRRIGPIAYLEEGKPASSA